MDLSSVSGHLGIDKSQRHLRFSVDCAKLGLFLAFFDIVGAVCASVGAHLLYRTLAPGSYGFYSLGSAAGIGLLSGFFFVTIVKSSGSYDLSAFLDGKNILPRISSYVLFSAVLLIVSLFLLRAGPNISRGTFLYFLPLQQIVALTGRVVATRAVKTLLENDLLVGPSAVLIGDESELGDLSARFLLTRYGVREVGRVAIAGDASSALGEALGLSRKTFADTFVVAIKWNEDEKFEEIREGLRRSALPAVLLPDTTVRRVSKQCMGVAHRTADRAITLQRAPMSAATLAVKRAVDVIVASVAILALAPLMAVAALAIKLDSKGPVIFKQRRHGFDRRPFTIFKFRSMTVLEDGASIVQAVRGDRRVTKVGAFLRRTSIDELPQLLNVMLGHMSLVGPRPHALAHDNIYSDQIDRYYFRHHAKPGITGWAQINGARGQTEAIDLMKRRVELDLWYVDHCSIWLDLLILARTCLAVFKDDAF